MKSDGEQECKDDKRTEMHGRMDKLNAKMKNEREKKWRNGLQGRVHTVDKWNERSIVEKQNATKCLRYKIRIKEETQNEGKRGNRQN